MASRTVHGDPKSGRRTTVSVRDAAPGMAWVVRSVLEPRATGRPCLLIESGDRCQSARAEAFDVP